jgi:hypothetical protein
MDKIKNEFQIVVARYEEDVSWLKPYKDITIIYNKGSFSNILNNFEVMKLENVGRESHTYIYHIVSNYDNLADKTIFFQGKINDHKILEIEEYFGKNDFIGKIDNYLIDKLNKHIDHYGKWVIDYKNGNMLKSDYIPSYWLKKIIGIDIDSYFENQNNSEKKINVVWGANFSISKKMILSKPKIFYQNILRFLDTHKNPEIGHYLERTWYLIFHCKYIKKNLIGYIFIKNNIEDYLEKINILINNDQEKFKDIHLWYPIKANEEIGDKYKICYTPNNNKYLKINPEIINNSFYLDIKGNNDAHVLIEFYDTEDSYEIVFGGWNNKKSVIRNYNKNKIISVYDNVLLNSYEYLRFNFLINENLIIQHKDKNIFNIENNMNMYKIKNIKIISYFNSSIFWDYKDKKNLNKNEYPIKIFMTNNIYDNIDHFYSNYYLDYYIEKIYL